jgi:hypothetical protein
MNIEFDSSKTINMLNLDCIKVKLIDKNGDTKWSLEQANEVEKWYKRYLFLAKKYPEKNLVPTRYIDIFWHQHILDTQKYNADCIVIFGYFLHHFPYSGMNGEEDYKNHEKSSLETLDLYQKYFGESIKNLDEYFDIESNNNVGCRNMCACGNSMENMNRPSLSSYA